ncbi:MAG: type II secretion system protein [Candidatus Roizmanbacteria bacterium]|nr:type II secretion system protein [Candidatus Roizmanbacteria bacterium]
MGIKHKSFTLIELIVAVGVVGFVLPSVFNIFFTMIRQQLILVSYQEMKQQGDSIERNIKNILQTRTAYLTDSLYATNNPCPLFTTPTPTFSPEMYIRDRNEYGIKLYQKTVSGVDTIASDSADRNNSFLKTYNLSSKDVLVSDFGYSCFKVNDYSLPFVTTTFTMHKSTVFTDMVLPYSFKLQLRNY